jgi:hypothetical protein
VAAAGAVGAGCSGPGAEYRTAVAADSSERYRAFLYEYPTGEYSAEVEARLEDRLYRDLREAHDSGDIGSSTLLALADAYLDEYPDGKRKALVLGIKTEVEDEIRMLELCPLPLLDEVPGAAARVEPLIAARCLWLLPGELRYMKVEHSAPSDPEKVVSAEIVAARKGAPVEIFVAQIKDGATVVVGFEAPLDARAGSWLINGKVRMITAGAVKKAAEAKAAKKPGGKPAVLEVPFAAHLAIETLPSPYDERDAHLLGKAWALYERKAVDKENERDLNGFCRSSKKDLYARCGRLTDEAAVLREARDRAAVSLKELASGPDDKARAAAAEFFAAHPDAKKASRKPRPAPAATLSAPGTAASGTAAPTPTAKPATAGPAPATAAPATAAAAPATGATTAAPASATAAAGTAHAATAKPKGTAKPKPAGTAKPKPAGSGSAKPAATAAPASAKPAATAAPASAKPAATAAPASAKPAATAAP